MLKDLRKLIEIDELKKILRNGFGGLQEMIYLDENTNIDLGVIFQTQFYFSD